MFDHPLARRMLALCGIALAAPCVASEPSGAFLLSPGVVADAQARVAYAADPEGRIQAIDLKSGKSLWLSDLRGLPLALTEAGKLLVLDHAAPSDAGKLVLLNGSDGKPGKTVNFRVPEGVSASANPQPQRRFTVVAQAQPAGVRLYWEYQDWPLQGAMLAEEGVEPPEPNLFRGVVDIDPEAALATPVALDEAGPLPQRIPNLSAAERIASVSAPQFRAADQQHVLASSPVSDPLFGTAYRWSVHAWGEAESLGSVQSPHATAPFFIDGNTLVARVEPYAYRLPSGQYQVYASRLAGFDLKSGATRWSVDVQDLNYRGPLPP